MGTRREEVRADEAVERGEGASDPWGLILHLPFTGYVASVLLSVKWEKQFLSRGAVVRT